MILKINDLHKRFNNLTIFKNFNIELESNKISCLLGPSGCGKTTLLNILCGLIEADSMKSNLNKDITYSYIFQEPRLLDWLTVFENLDFVLKDIYKNKSKRHSVIEYYLSMVNLLDFKDYLPRKLSGGMKQRVSIARAFAHPSDVLLMDEPFKGLDINLKNNLIDSFLDIWKSDKRTVAFVTHDIDEALKIGHKLIVLNNSPAEIIYEKDIIDLSDTEISLTKNIVLKNLS